MFKFVYFIGNFIFIEILFEIKDIKKISVFYLYMIDSIKLIS